MHHGLDKIRGRNNRYIVMKNEVGVLVGVRVGVGVTVGVTVDVSVAVDVGV